MRRHRSNDASALSQLPPLRPRPFARPIALGVSIVVFFTGGCATSPRTETTPSAPTASSAGVFQAPTWSARPGYYKDDGPGDNPPANLDAIPDAVPVAEPLHRYANRPYTVLGRDYVPATAIKTYRERGIASWYGRRFHGQKTSTGEIYDMYAMTAAHPTLPLPSYARVTNTATGKSVVVRVNDRGPFLHSRVIDLSYAAAYKIGIAQKGSGEVVVEAIVPSEQTVAAAAPATVPSASPSIVAAASPPALTAPSQTMVAAASPSTMSPAVPSAASPGAPQSAPASPSTITIPSNTLALVSESPSLIPGGFSVQLGAFASYDNAQNFLAHVQNQLMTAQVEARVRQAGGLYRVYVGPYTDRDAARRVGERISNAFGLSTTIAPH